MKSTKVESLAQFDRNVCILILELKTPLQALGKNTGMKTELHQANVKSQDFIYRASFQHKLH